MSVPPASRRQGFAMVAGEGPNLARRELEAFFRRREECENLYCLPCLVVQLTLRGSRAIAAPAWMGAVEEAFERPGPLQVWPHGPCAACGKPSPSLGLRGQDAETTPP